VSLKSLGLKIQLNHGTICENPLPCHSSMAIIHTNGIHEVAFLYCGCSRAIPQNLQLLRRQIYPSSQLNIMTCATFELLHTLHTIALTTKSSTFDLYRALEKITNNTGVSVPKTKYRALSRMFLQWRHLKLLKWGGRAHDSAGPEATKPGELALRCPSCPYPGINLPKNWREATARQVCFSMPHTSILKNLDAQLSLHDVRLHGCKLSLEKSIGFELFTRPRIGNRICLHGAQGTI